MKKKLHELGKELAFPLAAVAAAFILGGLLMLMIGVNPLAAYKALLDGAFGSLKAISGTIDKSVPLIFTGLALAFGFKCQVFNMGAEGQLLFGGLAAALIGRYVTGLPAVLHLPLTILGGLAAGGLWALPPALLKVRRGVNEVIGTIMMNTIGALAVSYFIMGVCKAPGELNATEEIQPTAAIGGLQLGGITLNYSFLLALAACMGVYLFLNKTTMGYEIKAVGLNRDAAEYAGINANKSILLVFIISGMLASLAGVTEITGNYMRIYDGFSPGYGADGISIALLANCNPFGVILSSLLFGALRYGATMMQAKVGVSKEIVVAIQAMIVLLVASEKIFKLMLARREQKRRCAQP